MIPGTVLIHSISRLGVSRAVVQALRLEVSGLFHLKYQRTC